MLDTKAHDHNATRDTVNPTTDPATDLAGSHRSRRLLFYTPSLGDGGAERLWASLASAFDSRGCDVTFVQDFEASESRHLLNASIPIHTLGRNHMQSINRLAGLLKEINADVAFSAVAGSNLKLITAQRLARTKTAIVQSFHGHDEWKTGWLSYLTARALPLTSRQAVRTLAVSETLRDELIAKWSAVADRTITMANPVYLPDNIDVPSRAGLSGRDPVILSVGRLAPEKDFATLVRAVAQLDDKNARLVIVGQGPEEDRLRNLIRELGIDNRVTLTGYISDPWHYYRNAKCFALTSTTESFGNVIVEALAHGLPVVATDTVGARTLLNAPALGERVALADTDQITSALSRALNEPGDPQPRAAFAQTHGFENRFVHYEQLVRDILKETSAATAEYAGAGDDSR